MVRTTLSPRLTPALLVRDMDQTLSFYKLLGFEQTGGPPESTSATWSEVRRDSIVLQFHTEAPSGTLATPSLSGTLYMYPESVEALADEFRGKVEFVWGSEVMEYGMREFGIQDPNDYFLAFAESVD